MKNNYFTTFIPFFKIWVFSLFIAGLIQGLYYLLLRDLGFAIYVSIVTVFLISVPAAVWLTIYILFHQITVFLKFPLLLKMVSLLLIISVSILLWAIFDVIALDSGNADTDFFERIITDVQKEFLGFWPAAIGLALGIPYQHRRIFIRNL